MKGALHADLTGEGEVDTTGLTLSSSSILLILSSESSMPLEILVRSTLLISCKTLSLTTIESDDAAPAAVGNDDESSRADDDSKGPCLSSDECCGDFACRARSVSRCTPSACKGDVSSERAITLSFSPSLTLERNVGSSANAVFAA